MAAMRWRGGSGSGPLDPRRPSTEDKELTLAELSKRTDLYKSTVLRLLKSLEKFGYLRRSDGSYRLGSKVLLLGSLYQRHFRTASIVPPVLEIAAELHEGASFYVCEDDKRICLHRVETTRAVRDSVHVGDRLPLTVGAAGHVMRAFNGGAASASTRSAATCTPPRSASATRRPRRSRPGPRPGQQFVGALSVSGPRYRIEALAVAAILPVLFKDARDLTRIMGGDTSPFTFAARKGRPAKRAARR